MLLNFLRVKPIGQSFFNIIKIIPLLIHQPIAPELELFGLLPYVTVAKAFVDLPEAEFRR